MSVYLIKGKGWRYDFTLNRQRYTGAWYKTKTEARQAETERRKEMKDSKGGNQVPTDMDFLELVNRRLDHIKAYNSQKHYEDYCYLAKKWVQQWGRCKCGQITPEMVERYILQRAKVSEFTANKEIRSLRSLFNFGKKKKLVSGNPTDNIDFLPEGKRMKYVPPPEDIDKVLAVTNPDARDYLWTIRDVLARVSEINRLKWDDVGFSDRCIVLYTRKKKGGHLAPRKVPLTKRLHKILLRRFQERDESIPWVFWHTYRSRKTGEKRVGPYGRRKRLMKGLCKKAGVQYFQFHALRHSGASLMDNNNVPMGAIQRILGHENRSTTEIYLHSLGQAERDAIAKFEHVTSKSLTQSLTQE